MLMETVEKGSDGRHAELCRVEHARDGCRSHGLSDLRAATQCPAGRAPCRVITTSLVEVVAVIRECQHLLDLCVLGWTFPDRMNAPPWFRRPWPG